MHIKLKATPGIYLVGFMGSGKSTVGQLLAERLGWDFIDLDSEIESREGITITEIFDRAGELAFREIEQSVLQDQAARVRQAQPRVVALGGGAFGPQASRELLATAGVSIWLDCPCDLLWERVSGETHRPLAQDRQAFERLFRQREPVYSQADFRVAAAGPPAEIVESVFELGLF